MGTRAGCPPQAAAPAEQQQAAGSEDFVNTGEPDGLTQANIVLAATLNIFTPQPWLAGLQTWLERRRQWTNRGADQKQQQRSKKRSYS